MTDDNNNNNYYQPTEPYQNDQNSQPDPAQNQNQYQGQNTYQNQNQYQYQNQYQNPYPYQGQQMPPKEEKASVGLAILSFIFPIAGLIIFLVDKDKRPKTAKVSGICALVSFILGVVITILSNVLMASTVTKSIMDEDSYYSDYGEEYDYDGFEFEESYEF